MDYLIKEATMYDISSFDYDSCSSQEILDILRSQEELDDEYFYFITSHLD